MVAIGLTVIIGLVEPLSHKYDNEPLPLNGIAAIVADEPLQMVWFAIGLNVTLGERTVTTAEFVAVAVHKPSVAVTVTVYVVVTVGLMFIVCVKSPVVHSYDNVPLLLDTIAFKYAEEPLQIVCAGIVVNVTLGALTFISTELVAVAVQAPSVAVATTV